MTPHPTATDPRADHVLRRYMRLDDRRWHPIPEEIDRRALRAYCDAYGIEWQYRPLILADYCFMVMATSSELTTIYRDMREMGAWR